MGREDLVGGRYRVRQELGSGGMGTVFLAEDLARDGAPVALKWVGPPEGPPPDSERRTALAREFETLARLRHPNLPLVHDFGQVEKTESLFLSMEYVEGPDLLAAASSLSPAETITVIAQVCRALEFIHTRGLIHRDLKPQNILVTGAEGGQPKAVLVDFGLASPSRDETALRGTLQYFAPEVLRGERADRRADLYALGILLYRLAAGRCPYEGSSQEIIKGHLEEPPAPPADLVGKGEPAPLRDVLDANLYAVILRLLEKDPARRYPTAAETLQALNQATGADHPIETAETGSAYAASATMVGRDPEIAAAAAAVDSALRRLEKGVGEKETALLLVRGEAGWGKTRFLQETKRLAQVKGCVAARVGCGFDRPPFQPIAEAISLLGGERLNLGDETPGTSVSAEKARIRAVDAAASRLAAVASEKAVVLCIDDAQRADAGTLEVLEALARNLDRAPGLCLALSYRPEELEGSALEAALGRIRRAVPAPEVSLEPLDRDRTHEMIRGMLGLAEIPGELLDLIHRETSGNPLFVEHAVRSLMEDGSISRVGSGFRADVDALTSISFPLGVGEAIRRRLRALGPDARRVLEVMAVIDRSSDLELLRSSSGGIPPLDALEPALGVLEQRGMVQREETRGGSTLWAISNARTREVVYEQADPERRRDLHRRVAEVLEEREGRGEEIRYEEIARHFIHGPDHAKALDYALEAAERARAVGASAEAKGFLRRALDLLPPGSDDRRAELLLRVGVIDRELGRDVEAGQCFEEALRASQGASRTDLAASARLEKTDMLLRRGKMEEASREIERALESLSGSGHLGLMARAYSYMAGVQGRTGQVDRALDLQKRALESAEQSGEAPRIAAALNNLGMLLFLAKRHEEGFQSLERAIEIRRKAGDPYGEMETTSNLGSLLAEAGRLDQAAERLERSVTLARELNDLPSLAEGQINLGKARANAGRLDAAFLSFEEAAAIAIRIGRDAQASYALDAWGLALRILGDHEGAVRRHGEALERARRAADPVQEHFALASLALDHAAAGEPEKMKEYLRRASRVQGAEPPARARLRSLEAEGLAHLRSGAILEADASAQAMRELAASESLLRGEARALWIRSRSSLARGDARGACEALEEAARIADREDAIETRCLVLSSLAGAAEAAGLLERARAVAAEARRVIEERARRIEDEEIRRRYLAVPERKATLSERPATTQSDRSPIDGSALMAIYRMSEILTSGEDVDGMLSRVLDLALEIVRAERGLVILVSEDGDRQEVRAGRGVEPETIADALEYSHSVVKEAAEGKTLVMLDAETEEAFRRFRSVSMFHIKSLACVPMKVGNRIIGTVYLDSREEGYLFREEDLEFLRALANLSAAALEMARLNAHLASQNVELRREVQDLRREAGQRIRYQEMVGRTPRMQAVYDMLDRVSASTLPVLVTGESGTGKELVARALHYGGPRKDRPFIGENVAAIPDTLLESTLFGHMRGSFTGADRDHKGVFERADGGTLFLDEIGDMSLPLQAKLLRALQDGEIRPVGGKRSIKVDVRVISATNRNIHEMVREGKFREDLFFRLNVVPIEVPPLRERKEDIPLLVEHFLEKAATEGTPRKKLDMSALQLMVRYDWPGNVRELENETLKLAALTPHERITQQDLASVPGLFDKLTDLEGRGEEFPRMQEMERRQIERALIASAGNRAKAAKMLGISRATIYRKIREYRISA